MQEQMFSMYWMWCQVYWGSALSSWFYLYLTLIFFKYFWQFLSNKIKLRSL